MTREAATATPAKPSAMFPALAAQWAAASAAAVGFAVVLALLSPGFATSIEMARRPIITLVAVLVVSLAAAMVFLPALVRRSSSLDQRQAALLVWCILLAGLVARIALFGSQPILENDFQRYLWDGAVTAHGQNPYAVSPATLLLDDTAASPLANLASEGRETLERIGHKDLTTIYPPIAQSTFALAHLISPFSLDGWRLVLLAGDTVTLFLLIHLLDGTGRTRLWISLYWLNPLVLKEVFNSAHMEAILLPFVLGALVLAWQRRDGWTAALLALAAGVKLWPVILAPLVARARAWPAGRMIGTALFLGAAMALWIFPMLTTAPGETAGLLAYAQSWQTNSALSPALETTIAALLPHTPGDDVTAARLARVVLGAALAAVVLLAIRRPVRTLDDLIARTSMIICALVLLSPAQYPWYLLWYAPFLAFQPAPAMRTAMVSVPLYYLSFYFAAHDQSEVFAHGVVWLIWIPVWIALLWPLHHRLAPKAPPPARTHEA